MGKTLPLLLMTLACIAIFFQTGNTQDLQQYHSFTKEQRQKNAVAAAAQPPMRAAGSIEVNKNYTAEELIRDIFISGGCFDVTNIHYTGDADAKGRFTNGADAIGIEDGIILSTGDINNARGPNTSNARSTGHNVESNDPDLHDLVNGATDEIWDQAVLEFDFTPTTDMVSFEYAFASEEYCEFAGDEYNDVFGFFISGPGINGDFYNNAENIALIPETDDFVSINSVNHFENENYYVPNERAVNVFSCFKPFEAVALDEIEYDGFTKVLTATTQVIPCETYHIRLTIGDGGDAIYDSAVFLKANSFNAGGTAIASGLSQYSGTNIAYETCNDASFVFERTSDDLDNPITINFVIDPASTAVEGVDFGVLPDSVVIPPGMMQTILPVDILSDALAEGLESLIIEIDNACSCTVSTTELWITEAPPIPINSMDIEVCEQASIFIEAVSEPTEMELTYLWNDGSTDAILETTASNSTIYTVTVTDPCGQSVVENYAVNVTAIPRASIDGSLVLCESTDTDTLEVVLEGTAPWEVVYSIDGVSQTPIQTSEAILTIPVENAGIYTLESVVAQGCAGEAKGTVVAQASDMSVSHTAVAANCYNDGMGRIELTTVGSTAPYHYLWNDTSIGDTAVAENIPPGTYTITVTDQLGCTQSHQIEVPNQTDAPEVEINESATITCADSMVAIQANITFSPSPNNTLLWTSPNGNIVSGSNTLSPFVNRGGNYHLLVTNEDNGCTVEAQTIVSENTALPQAQIMPAGNLTCTDTTVELDLNTLNADGFTYVWSTLDGNILSATNIANPTVDAAGTYFVTLTDMENACTNTLQVSISEDRNVPQVFIENPEALTCTTREVTLWADIEANFTTTLAWINEVGTVLENASERQITVTEAGRYQLIVTNEENGCTTDTQVEVIENTNYPTAVVPQVQTPICQGEAGSIIITEVTGGEPPYLYSLDGGENFFGTPDFTTVLAGTYPMVIQDVNGCEYEESVTLQDGNAPTLSLEPMVELQLGDDYQIEPTINLLPSQIQNVTWSPDAGLSCTDCLRPTLFPLENSDYSLTITDENGCTATADIAFRVRVEENIYIPNAFSPNDDGINDIFQLYAQENLVAEIRLMQIFDRWGNLVFEERDFAPNSQVGWNGSFRNRRLQPAVYLYHFEVALINGKVLQLSGDITLL